MSKIRRLGLIVNPIAGLGGSVGLKGTDGIEIINKAIALGAKPVAPDRAKETLGELRSIKGMIELITYPEEMGETEAKECGFDPIVIGDLSADKTTADDTKNAAKAMQKLPVDLLLFCGGDGTATDIVDAIDKKVPIIGIPAGVKMHSAVFTTTPTAAAEITIRYLKEGLPLREEEVVDIDEVAFREGRLSTSLKGYALVPYEPVYLQGVKVASPITHDDELDKEAIARRIVEEMEPNILYILGPGTTLKAITDLLKVGKTPLGVDLLENKQIVAKDVNEKQILKAISGKSAKIIVTLIGNQGFIFGRGNQQISPKVIKKVGLKNIIVIATPYKLSTTPVLRVDTGDKELDSSLKGYMKVLSGYTEKRVLKVH
ncbi:MAG: ATP-NAD kinase family protein [Promethearchaeota archaeon]